ncbi:hypothetical protein [Vibrio sp. HN007]|uniref:hypothetical protein n=1 Tax=Vibrio iocasae TaxID=3098914 RepID=UPI0035D4E994
MKPVIADTSDTKVNWALYSFPPYLTPANPPSKHDPIGNGPAAVFLKYTKEHMPEFQHEYELATLSRVIGLMKNGVLACNPLLLKIPEREPFVEYSRPIMVLLPHHIIVTEANFHKLKPYLDSEGKVELSKLVTNTDLSTSITKRRAYPTVVSDALDSVHGNQPSILYSADLYTPIKQLIAKRIDYVVAYPFEMYWYISEVEKKKDLTLKYIPISGMPEYVLSYVGCTKGEQGKKIIQETNKVIADAGSRPPWVEYQLSYLDEAARSKLEHLLDQYQFLRSP